MFRKALSFLHASDGSLQHKAIRSGAWVGVSTVFTAALTLLRGIILARLLTPEIFGLMAVSMMAIRLMEIFTETGFGQALIHRKDGFEEARDTAFTMLVLRGLGLAALSLIAAPLVASFYQEPVLQSIVAVIGISFILSGFQNINTVALQKNLDFRRLTYLELATATLGFVASVGLAYWLRSVWALVFGQIANAAIVSILSFIIVPGRIRFEFKVPIARELYSYGRFITGLAIVVFLSRELDNAIIGKILGMQMLGYYVIAYSLANIPSTYLSKMIAKVMFPLFSQLQSDAAALRREYARGIRLVTSVAVPVSAAIIVLAPQVILALYGAQWAEATIPLQVLAVFGCFRSLWMLNGYLYNAIGRPEIDFHTNLGRLVMMSILLFPLTTRFGLLGASLAVTIPMVLQFGLGIWLSDRHIGARASTVTTPFVLAVAQSALLAAILMAVRSVISADPKMTLILLAAVCGTVWTALNLRGLRSTVSALRAR